MDLSYEELKQCIKGEPLPVMVVDLDAFDRNLEHALNSAPPNVSLRIATKSVRVPLLLKRALSRAGRIQGLMCYSAQEAHELHARGFDDFLVAYPTVQPSDMRALRELHDGGVKISIVVDSLAQAEQLELAMKGTQRPFNVLVDIDLSLRCLGGLLHFGVRRSPLRSLTEVSQFVKRLKAFQNLKCVGMMGYEAQVAGLQDRNPFSRVLNPIKKIIRTVSQKRAIRFRAQVLNLMREEGLRVEIVNGGGSGNLNWLAKDQSITEVTVGSGLLNSHLFDYYSNISFEPASFFALQVVRSSDPGIVTCAGGGYVASGEAGKDRLPVPYLPKGSQLIAMEGAGEVQTPVRVRTQLALGEPHFFRGAKAGEIMERFKHVLCISQRKVVERTETYRGLGWDFF